MNDEFQGHEFQGHEFQGHEFQDDEYDENENDVFDLAYYDNIHPFMCPEDKLLYELCGSLYVKCMTFYHENFKTMKLYRGIHTDGKYTDLDWEAFPYEEISERFPYTYNKIIVHLIEASNPCRRDSIESENTMYGNVSDTGDTSENAHKWKKITTREIVSIVEMLMKHVKVLVYGMSELILLYSVEFGSISIFDSFMSILKKDQGDFAEIPRDIPVLLKHCHEYLLGYMSSVPIHGFSEGFDILAIQKARIYIATIIYPDTKPYFDNKDLFGSNTYISFNFFKALKNGLHLIGEFIIEECNKHKVECLNESFTSACIKGDTETIRICCKFDPYRYSVQHVLPILCVDSAGNIHTENINMMISENEYGIIHSPKNRNWRRVCSLLQATHYGHSYLPIDVVRMISSFY